MYASYNMWVGGIYGKKQNVNNVYLLKDEIMNDLIFFFAYFCFSGVSFENKFPDKEKPHKDNLALCGRCSPVRM